MQDWYKKGCESCRASILQADPPPQLAESLARQSTLHRCSSCGVLWEIHAYGADVIPPDEACQAFPDAALGETIPMPELLNPINTLEHALVDASAGQISFEEFIRVFAAQTLVVPSATPVDENGLGLSPAFFYKPEFSVIVAFTDLTRVARLRKTLDFQFCVAMNGSGLLNWIPSGVGLVVNPGFDKGFELAPNDVAGIRDIPRED